MTHGKYFPFFLQLNDCCFSTSVEERVGSVVLPKKLFKSLSKSNTEGKTSLSPSGKGHKRCNL